jgi:hypothetical protein
VPAALQCPDCGHQEMLDNLGGVTTFRCGGCGRALKVPAQFREPAARGPGSRPPSPGEPTQAMPRVRPDADPPVASAPVPPVVPTPAPTPAPVPRVPVAGPPVAGPPVPGLPTGRSPIAEAGGPNDIEGSARPAPIPPESLRPPVVLRLALWAIALPLGSLLVFGIASSLKILTKAQLEDTFLLAGWGRFVPIARLLPFCALATALIVQLGVFGLERLRVRNLRNRPPHRSGPGMGAGPGPTRPHAPGGSVQRGTNGSRSRDRVIS